MSAEPPVEISREELYGPFADDPGERIEQLYDPASEPDGQALGEEQLSFEYLYGPDLIEQPDQEHRMEL